MTVLTVSFIAGIILFLATQCRAFGRGLALGLIIGAFCGAGF